MLLRHYFQKRGLADKTRLSLYTMEGAPMMTAGPEMGKFVRDSLAERNIAFHPLKKTLKVDRGKRTIQFEDSSEARYDLLIAVPPHEAPAVVRETGLLNQSGWLPVNPKSLLAVEGAHPTFAIGDVTVAPLPGRFKPDTPLVLPKAGVFAERQARVVAANIAARILGKNPSEVYDGKGYCYIEMGDGHAVRGDGSFYEMPHPTMTRRTPDRMQFEEKLAWAENWMKTNL
jgi:sulfide:quinone oxidoreductase